MLNEAKVKRRSRCPLADCSAELSGNFVWVQSPTPALGGLNAVAALNPRQRASNHSGVCNTVGVPFTLMLLLMWLSP